MVRNSCRRDTRSTGRGVRKRVHDLRGTQPSHHAACASPEMIWYWAEYTGVDCRRTLLRYARVPYGASKGWRRVCIAVSFFPGRPSSLHVGRQLYTRTDPTSLTV